METSEPRSECAAGFKRWRSGHTDGNPASQNWPSLGLFGVSMPQSSFICCVLLFYRSSLGVCHARF